MVERLDDVADPASSPSSLEEIYLEQEVHQHEPALHQRSRSSPESAAFDQVYNDGQGGEIPLAIQEMWRESNLNQEVEPARRSRRLFKFNETFLSRSQLNMITGEAGKRSRGRRSSTSSLMEMRLRLGEPMGDGAPLVNQSGSGAMFIGSNVFKSSDQKTQTSKDVTVLMPHLDLENIKRRDQTSSDNSDFNMDLVDGIRDENLDKMEMSNEPGRKLKATTFRSGSA